MPFNSDTARAAGKKSSRKNVPNLVREEGRQQLIELFLENLPKARRELRKMKGKDFFYCFFKLGDLASIREKRIVQSFDPTNMSPEQAAGIINELTKSENPIAEEIIRQLDENRKEFIITFNID